MKIFSPKQHLKNIKQTIDFILIHLPDLNIQLLPAPFKKSLFEYLNGAVLTLQKLLSSAIL